MASDPADIAHLLRRTEFVARPARVAQLASMDLAAAVADVLDTSLNPASALPAYLTYHDTNNSWNQYIYALSWWTDRMVDQPRPLQEKMTFFWHGHFCTSWDKVFDTKAMCEQNQLFRTNALGNFRTLAQAMAIGPAMIAYLDNAENRKGEPNQNFARELMELFTLGVGNYTEDDVDAASRAWTGHGIDWNTHAYLFRTNEHDSGTKTFFGTARNWDGPDIINEILRDNASTKQIAARYLVRKLWEFFAHQNPDPVTIVNPLADVLLASDFSVTPLLQAMFTSPFFYATAARQGMVRTPVDFYVAVAAATGARGSQLHPEWFLDGMGQLPFFPPNVSGWRPNAYWVNTSALGGRANFARWITFGLRDGGGFDEIFAMTAPEAVDYVAGYFGIAPLSTVTRDALIAWHAAEKGAHPWNSYWLATNLLVMTMLAPEMHTA